MNQEYAPYAHLAMDIWLHSTEADGQKAGLKKIEEELMRVDLPEINIPRLMRTLSDGGWKDKQVQAIFLAVHGDPDNGKTYFTT